MLHWTKQKSLDKVKDCLFGKYIFINKGKSHNPQFNSAIEEDLNASDISEWWGYKSSPNVHRSSGNVHSELILFLLNSFGSQETLIVTIWQFCI